MLNIRISEDLEECGRIWNQVWPQHTIFDRWQVRLCFASGFDSAPCFIVAEETGAITGLLALSWVEESCRYGNFPGEIWQGKTWLEQNKVVARSSQSFQALLESVPAELHLRYLDPEFLPVDRYPLAVDEVGFIFIPRSYGYKFSDYLLEFSTKSRKKINREIDLLQNNGVAFRYGNSEDVQWLFHRNLESFGDFSYFSDPRFLSSFEKLVAYLFDNGLLRVTTVLLGGVVAAVDVGAVWKNCYTVLAGATNPDFPGVAKIINLHHLEWACRQRLDVVDFLCGDFGWKNRFHLTQRPLYEIHRRPAGSRTAELRSGSIS